MYNKLFIPLQQTVVVELKKGQNTVRLHNDHERMPDVDYLSVETK
jgi:hypothetical protein